MKRTISTLCAVSLLSAWSTTLAPAGDHEQRADGQRAWEAGLSDRWVYKRVAFVPSVPIQSAESGLQMASASDGTGAAQHRADGQRAWEAGLSDRWVYKRVPLIPPGIQKEDVVRAEEIRLAKKASRSANNTAVGGTGTSSLSGSSVTSESSKGNFENETDRAISDRVRTGLVNGSWDNASTAPSQNSLNGIEISTHNGVVTLRGDVSSSSEKKRIAKRAKEFYGVRSVKNELRVQP